MKNKKQVKTKKTNKIKQKLIKTKNKKQTNMDRIKLKNTNNKKHKTKPKQ